MKTLGMVTFALLVLVIMTGCGATQQVGFGSTAAAKTSAIDCASADLEVTAEQIQTEIDAYESNCLEVPADLIEAANQVGACSENSDEKLSGATANGGGALGGTAIANQSSALANTLKNSNDTKKSGSQNLRKACAYSEDEFSSQDKTISGTGMGGSTGSGQVKGGLVKIN